VIRRIGCLAAVSRYGLILPARPPLLSQIRVLLLRAGVLFACSFFSSPVM
jgi:hypothetical protein